MNKVELMGRLVRDPEVKYTPGENALCVARYTLAINRKSHREDADFINITAFGKTAELAKQYLRKGRRIVIVGHIQSGSYIARNGQKVYTTDVIAEEQYFADNKPADINTSAAPAANGEMPEASSPSISTNAYMEINDEVLPFPLE